MSEVNMKVFMVSLPVQDPIAAHQIYTEKLGFISVEFMPEASIAVVKSPEEPDGTVILLEPCAGTFAEDYQKAAFAEKLPIMVFSVANAQAELARLRAVGVKVRPDLDRPE